MNIELSPMDYYFYRHSLYTIQFVFEYEGHVPADEISKGLLIVPRSCAAAGSRLKIVSDRQIRLETGHPIPFRARHLDHDVQGTTGFEDFLDPIINAEDEPLVKLLATYTPQRTFVGVSFSHLLGDGSSFFQFMLTLSKAIKGHPIDFDCGNDRSLLSDDKAEFNLSLFESTGYVRPRPPNPFSYKIESIHYTFEELSHLKRQYGSSKTALSSNDLLMADLAKRFHRDIPLHEGRFIVRCPVDYRDIYDLPKTYFGNAVRDAVAEFHPGEMEVLSLGEIASRIRSSIRSIDKFSVRKSLGALEHLRQEHGIKVFEDVGCPGLLVSNLSKLPIHSVDLGTGSPTRFHHASLNPRLALILPHEKGLKAVFKRPLSKEENLSHRPSPIIDSLSLKNAWNAFFDSGLPRRRLFGAGEMQQIGSLPTWRERAEGSFELRHLREKLRELIRRRSRTPLDLHDFTRFLNLYRLFHIGLNGRTQLGDVGNGPQLEATARLGVWPILDQDTFCILK